MKTVTNHLYAILIIMNFCCCAQKKETSTTNEIINSVLSDSAKLEQYYQWSENITYINAYDYDVSVLKTTEIKRDSIMLLNFLTSYYDSVKLDTYFSYQPCELVKYVYAIDLNDDNLLDIVYNGPTSSEGNFTQFFLNKGSYYEKVFSGYQDITKADFTNNKLNSFVLINPACCADPQIVEHYYSVNYINNKPVFKLDKTIGYLSQTQKPQTLFSSPRGFSVVTKNAKLRCDCYFLDNVEHPLFGGEGNTIATYNAGCTGMALGLYIENNTEWVYVQMNATNKLICNNYPTFTAQPTEIRGWILKSETDLK